MNENNKKMSRIIQDTAGVRIAKFTVTNVTEHLCDSMKAPAGRILGNAKRSGNAKIDETSDSMAGEKYRGVVTSDKYSVYRRSGPGGRHQLCWARELRQLLHAAQKDNAPPSAKILHRQVLDVYCMALNSDRPGGHCIRLRREFESEMRHLLFRYRDTGEMPLKGT